MSSSSYAIGYEPDAVKLMQARTAGRCAGFLLPHLRPGMRILDCGCGPGTITIGIAKAVPDGEVVGVDMDSSQVVTARDHALKEEVGNVAFQQGDLIAGLPFPDGSFDVVFAHALFNHIADPLVGLREFRRLLRNDGLVAIRGGVWDRYIVDPETPLLVESVQWVIDAVAAHGGDLTRCGRIGSLLDQAGFGRVQLQPFFDSTMGGSQTLCVDLARLIEDTKIASVILERGWATRQRIEDAAHRWREFGQHDHQIAAFAGMEALAWLG